MIWVVKRLLSGHNVSWANAARLRSGSVFVKKQVAAHERSNAPRISRDERFWRLRFLYAIAHFDMIISYIFEIVVLGDRSQLSSYNFETQQAFANARADR